MESNGIMAEIRTHLSSGKSSGQVIALGFKPPTVYKVQSALRRKNQVTGVPSSQGSAQPPAATVDNTPLSELESENLRLKQEVENLENELEAEADDAMAFAAQVRSLEERVMTLEPEVVAAGQLRQRVKELEAELGRSNLTQVTMRQEGDQWRQKLAAEQAARQKLEEWAAKIWPEHQRLQADLQQFQQWEPRARQVFQTMEAELTALQPLAVWAGHPCQVCKQPMYGSVDRETAAKLMQGFGHKACLEKQGPGLGGLLAAGGVLLGLAQLGKR